MDGLQAREEEFERQQARKRAAAQAVDGKEEGLDAKRRKKEKKDKKEKKEKKDKVLFRAPRCKVTNEGGRWPGFRLSPTFNLAECDNISDEGCGRWLGLRLSPIL
jgi:hypothetical protein